MNIKFLLAAAIAASFAVPALAATTTATTPAKPAATMYYVVASCSITTKKPDGAHAWIIGSGYAKKSEAQAAEKGDAACNPPKG